MRIEKKRGSCNETICLETMENWRETETVEEEVKTRSERQMKRKEEIMSEKGGG